MLRYNSILVAIDLTEESAQVLKKASLIAEGSTVNVVHVSQPLAQLYGGEIGINLSSVEADLHKQAKTMLAERVGPFNVPDEKQHLSVGSPASEIRRCAEEIGADLIVIGTHSRHGLGMLLGSTANGVLHGTPCDVLTVKINTDN